MPVYSPTDVPVAGPGTPYISPAMLRSAATGISWTSIGGDGTTKPTVQQQYAEQLNICRRASSQASGYVNQSLHATIDTEQLTGPGDFRFQLEQNTGRAWLLLSRSPVTAVLGGQITAAGSFPAQWTTLAANQFRIRQPVIGVYGTTSPGGSGDGGQVVYMAPGNATWLFGRNTYDVQVTYVNGWPHTSLVTPAGAGDRLVHVDDCTGWGAPAGLASGATGVLYDEGVQETVTCVASSAASGPGYLSLAAPLNYAHGYGVLCSTLPGSIQQATIYYAVSQALVRGSTATAVQAVPGSVVGAWGSSKDFEEAAKRLLHPYRRVV